MRLRVIAPVLLVLAVTAAGFALTQIEAARDAWLVLAGGLGLVAVTGVLAAATERRRRALSEVERYFTLSPEMVVLAGFDGYWKRVNPAVEAVLGYTEREALARPFMEFVHPDDRERTEEEARRVIGGATALSFENRIVCKDGSYKWIEWTATPVPEDRVMYGVGRDITERRRSEREQTALRRIATFAAEAEQPQNLFVVVAEEVARVFDVPVVSVVRYDSDDTATECAASVDGSVSSTPRRWPLDSTSVLQVADAAREAGLRSTIGAAIVVEGRAWGAITVAARDRVLPPGTDKRLTDFAELVATAIANTHAREQVAALAEEQAALLRVATLVARGVGPEPFFHAVAAEVAALSDSEIGAIVRFEDDETVTVRGDHGGWHSPGARVKLDPDYVVAAVRTTRRVARFDTDDPTAAGVPELVRSRGVRSAIAAPVIVEDKVWGAITIASLSRSFAPDTERRLRDFTDLVATAVANAQARGQVTALADEQAALRRVATLVAEGATTTRLAASVLEEVVAVLGVPAAWLLRYEPERTMSILAVINDPWFPVGSRWPLEGTSVSAAVFETGRSARIDDFTGLEGVIAARSRESGFLSSLGVPIVVDGAVWGAICVGTTDREPLPPGTEDRLGRFTELVATAISNAEARRELQRVAAEQEALRKAATTVASGASPTEVFAMITASASELFDAPFASLLRYGPDERATMVAGCAECSGFVGQTWTVPADDPGIVRTVVRSREAARIEDHGRVHGPVGEAARALGIASVVGAPVIVDGSVWGVLAVGAARHGPPLPADAGERLVGFTELLTTTVMNAESREGLRRLVDEQAALRRVATLVAQGAQPDKVFLAVSEEVRRLFCTGLAAVGRVEPDGSALDFVRPDGGHERVELADLLASAEVFRTGRSARAGASLWESAEGKTAERLRSLGIVSIVSSPIVVEGEVWGIINVSSADEVLPPDTEERLEKFTEIVATAIANAHSRQALARLADEQAALRRVATLVARDAPSTEVFDAVATEVGNLLQTDITVVGRYDGDGAATAIGSWSSSPGGVPVGTRSALGGRNVLTLVAETGKPARVDGYDDASGEAADIARRHGWGSSIAAPIVVEDRLWGVMLVATQGPEPFPAAAEERLGAFTDLVATALANAQAHDEVRRFGDEQAALGRVATLVAAGAAPEEVFTAVVAEVSSLLGLERIELVRYDGDTTGTVIAASGDHPFPAGSTWSLDDPSVMATVARTGHAARIDDYGNLSGEIARAARSAGFQSAVGAPITVEGGLWGVVIAISTDPEPIPERSEARLAQFTELVATAVANADARRALERVASEQATLRRIATLVAEGLQPEEIFAVVSEEVGRLVGTDLTTVGRLEDDPPAFVAAALGKGMQGVDLGTSWALDDPLTAARVFQSGRSVRVNERLRERSPALAEMLARLGAVSTVSSPIMVEGRLWGAVMVASKEELPVDTEERLDKFTELVATAVANAESRSELAASRRRIVAASDETRRQIERDLHDGTQQRLVSLGMAVRAAEASLPPERDDLRAQLSGVATGLIAAVEDLQEISRGIHPAILSKGGLAPALQALAHRSAIPVDLDITADVRLEEPIEVAAYFVASEALANAAKHSGASRIDVLLGQRDGRLLLSVRDDGVGGADAARGSGLIGLTDRVEALGGSIRVSSPPGEGTQIGVELPVDLKLSQTAG